MEKERVAIFIDGSNFYHSTKKLKISNKINFNKLIKELIGDKSIPLNKIIDRIID